MKTYIAERTSQLQLPRSRYRNSLHRQDPTLSHPRHNQAIHNASLLLPLPLLPVPPRYAQNLLQLRPLHPRDVRAFPIRPLDRFVPHDRADRALEVAHARLARVVSRDVAERVLRELEPVGGERVRGELFWEEEAARDVDLLVVCIPR